VEHEQKGIRYQSRTYAKLETLMNRVNERSIKEEHQKQVQNKAVGIDGITKGEYGEQLDENVSALISRMKTFSYKPQPVRRVYIPKANGKLRPLGIPAYEDRLVQGVMAGILSEVYEERFLDCSYGFRPGRSAHQVVRNINQTIMTGKVNYILEADIKGFFDNVDHDWLMKFLEHDIEDKNFLRYIKRFLKSGIMESGKYINTDTGVPQGGNISPILANVYLHYAVDMWFDKVIKKSSTGMAEMIRYADDIVFCFQYESEAKAFYQELKERLAKFGLELSEEKSKIVKFGRFAGKDSGNFDFLGFTVITGKTRNGKYTPKYKTSEKKLKVKRAKIKKWIQENIRLPIAELIYKTNLRLQGHYNYYGISFNSRKLEGFYEYVKWLIKRGMNRRSQKDKTTWQRLEELLIKFPLVKPRIKVSLW